jgi:hypothetical protein
MPLSAKPIALLFAALIPAGYEAGAESVPPPAPKSAVPQSGDQPAVLTLKERLGAKWKDEQRVDNCNVPPEKRGTKPRPDACATIPAK